MDPMYLGLGKFTSKLAKIKTLILVFLKNTKLYMPECVWAHWHIISSKHRAFWEAAPTLFLLLLLLYMLP